ARGSRSAWGFGPRSPSPRARLVDIGGSGGAPPRYPPPIARAGLVDTGCTGEARARRWALLRARCAGQAGARRSAEGELHEERAPDRVRGVRRDLDEAERALVLSEEGARLGDVTRGEGLNDLHAPTMIIRVSYSAEPPTMAQQQADALALVAETALHHGIDPGAPAERYQVVVHVDAPALADPDQPGQSVLADGTHVSAETSRRLACDASRVVMRH